jgi:hypothetical protein
MEQKGNSMSDANSVIVAPRKAGRPEVYSKEQKAEFARLADQFGQSGAEKILKAADGEPGSENRNKDLFPNPLTNISKPTIAKAAKEHGVTFARGPRKTVVVVQVSTEAPVAEAPTVEELATA